MNVLPRLALIIVDVQNDFVEGGRLAVTGGNAAAEAITAYVRENEARYDLIVASRDWHKPDSENGGHFHPRGISPDFVGTWPPHCVQGTPGADYHEAIATLDDVIDAHIVKGIGIPAYSAFEGGIVPDAVLSAKYGPGVVNLRGALEVERISAVHVVGIATDHCVAATAIDSAEGGFPTSVLLDLCAGVTADTSITALKRMLAAGVTIDVSSDYREGTAA